MELANLIKVNHITGVRLCSPTFTMVSKTIILLNHHLILVSDKEDFRLLYKAIDSVRYVENPAERRYQGSGLFGFTLQICTKMFCQYELTIPVMQEARALYISLELLSNVGDLSLHYPFFYKPEHPLPVYRIPTVNDRPDLKQALASGRWRVSDANQDYSICSSYPEQVIVPSEASDQMIAESASFRRGSRFPMLAYYHIPRETALLIGGEPLGGQTFYTSAVTAVGPRKHSSATSGPHYTPTGPGSSLLTSQNSTTPLNALPTVPNNRCRADEQLLASVLPNRYRGAILDLRGQGQSVKKGGSQGGLAESEQYYPQWRRLSRAVETPGSLNGIFRKFIEACTNSRIDTHSAQNSMGVMHPGMINDSLHLLANAAINPLGGSSTHHTSDTAINQKSEDGKGQTLVSASDPTSVSESFSATGDSLLPTTMSTASGQNTYSPRRVAAWLSVVREALAAAVAGATALDARDAFAQQQLQQEQCLLAQKYKEQQRLKNGSITNSNAAGSYATNERVVVKEEARLRGSFLFVHSRKSQDRAIVVASLIQLILNPAARTISGFQALIEQTWIRGGFPFSERCGHSVFHTQLPMDHAPVFILFLDCTWQLWRQYPSCFEFTDELLFLLAQNSYYSEFGTFLGNCMKERDEINLDSRTVSLWSYLNQPRVRLRYTNPLYSKDDGSSDKVAENYACWPCLSSQALAVWQELYQRNLITDPTALWNRQRSVTRRIVDQFLDESEKVQRLRRLLVNLGKEAENAGHLVSSQTGR
ncbi:unnamed protein product [Calicophoron daubneyi]|uniref:Myotubularin phosphatase domain-containing protein n=1 Tax=Calicophoron daubneyi TaxID=300641 RepID=A0AAV2T4L3_CALDB